VLAPSRLQLSQFTSVVRESQNKEYILSLLAEQLIHADWKRRARSLYAIHELVVNNVPSSAEYFSTDGLPALLNLRGSAQKSIQDQVLKIFLLIRPDLSDPAAEPEVEPSAEAETFLPSTNESPKSQAPSQPNKSLFGELSVNQIRPTPPPEQPSPRFNTQVQAPIQTPTLMLGTQTQTIPQTQPLHSPKPTTPTANQSLLQNNINLIGTPQTYNQAEASRPRQTSKSQLETVFNDQQLKSVVQMEVEKMSWSSQPGQGYPRGYAAPFNPLDSLNIPQEQKFQPPVAQNISSKGSGIGGFDFVATTKKDPFDFGSIDQLDAQLGK